MALSQTKPLGESWHRGGGHMGGVPASCQPTWTWLWSISLAGWSNSSVTQTKQGRKARIPVWEGKLAITGCNSAVRGTRQVWSLADYQILEVTQSPSPHCFLPQGRNNYCLLIITVHRIKSAVLAKSSLCWQKSDNLRRDLFSSWTGKTPRVNVMPGQRKWSSIWNISHKR